MMVIACREKRRNFYEEMYQIIALASLCAFFPLRFLFEQAEAMRHQMRLQ